MWCGWAAWVVVTALDQDQRMALVLFRGCYKDPREIGMKAPPWVTHHKQWRKELCKWLLLHQLHGGDVMAARWPCRSQANTDVGEGLLGGCLQGRMQVFLL